MTNEAPVDMAQDQPASPPRKGRRGLWVAVAVLAVAIAAVLAMTQGQQRSSRTVAGAGKPAAPFTLENVRPGEPAVSLETLRGKPVVVNFWASWCVPCRREMPAFAALHASLGDKVAFVGINNKDFRDSALKFMEQAGVRYPSAFDPRGNIAARYGVVGMPATFFISGDGRVLDSRIGEINADDLRQTINRLYGIA